MIGRNPEVATQPLFFGKKVPNLIYLSFLINIKERNWTWAKSWFRSV